MSWRSFRIEPDDLLFFRDGKPSSRGADHFLRSLFPPHPSTLYGALRTRRLLDESVELTGLDAATWADRLGDLQNELGPWGGIGSLALRGPWLVRGGEPLVPAPADLGLLLEPGSGGKARPRVAEVVRFRPVPAGAAGTAGGAQPCLAEILFPFQEDGAGWRAWSPPAPGVEPRSTEGWFLTPAGLEAWRSGGVPAAGELVHAAELWEPEVRTGLGLERDRRSAEKSQIYTFGFVRLRRGVALGFEVADTGLAPAGRIRLGGEGRTAALAAGPAFPAARPGAGTGSRSRFCLSFLTPALSAAGGLPPGFAAGGESAELLGRSCRLVAGALPGFVTVGGWDLPNRRPKPLRRAIRPGAVFVFETVDGSDAGELARALDGTCHSDFAAEGLARQGFGLAVTGVVR